MNFNGDILRYTSKFTLKKLIPDRKYSTSLYTMNPKIHFAIYFSLFRGGGLKWVLTNLSTLFFRSKKNQ